MLSRAVSKRRKETTEDVIFNIVTTAIIVIGCFVIIYPLYFILIASISDPYHVLSGRVFLFPREIDFGGYERIFNYDQLWIGYRNSFFYTIVGSVFGTTVTIFGVEYTVRSDRDPAEVKRIAKYVNDKMWEISENNKLITSEKIAVLTALTIAEEFLELYDHRKVETNQLQTQTQNIIKLLDESKL